ncbi:MAG TPA: substrate-binding domain-containing protein [Candidatus Saccharicenans sp.]|mgnify:CR=1 FL=1|jgi:phosphate transport system substrate-binding protein|nr:substrate-binding domain-containing protein [Candidatus Saccharicenans sp.]HRD01519.1 substrate-binding domain-containing protein [Candidatus Saccharicenans sp.]
MKKIRWEKKISQAKFLAILVIILNLNFGFPASLQSSFPVRDKRAVSSQKKSLAGQISISGAWALYPLAVRWVEEFQKENPAVKIDLQAGGAGKGMADVLSGLVDIGMISREIFPEEIARGALPMAVARDAVVATLNEKNPVLKLIQERGLTREIFQAIWIEGQIKFWEEIYDQPGKTPIHLYTRSDACGAAETWAAFLGGHQEDLKGIAIYGDPGLAEAVRQDSAGLGFNNVNFAYHPETGRPHPGLAIGPIDIDQNGTLTPEEKFYGRRDELILAISRGVYPSPPSRQLYLVVKKPVSQPLVRAFLLWVLDQGQQYTGEAGYVALDESLIQTEKKKLSEN